MKPILFIALALMLPSDYVQAASNGFSGESKTISFGSFSIVIPEGWQYETETQLNKQVVTRIFHPERDGILQIGSVMHLPGKPSRDRVRLLTNLDSSVDLSWQKWGDLNGYQYDYTETGEFYRQWWLTHYDKIMFVVYRSSVRNDSLRNVIDEMVRSLTISV
jgi:hypothetical protein